jgi:hypothetical protein
VGSRNWVFETVRIARHKMRHTLSAPPSANFLGICLD